MDFFVGLSIGAIPNAVGVIVKPYTNSFFNSDKNNYMFLVTNMIFILYISRLAIIEEGGVKWKI